MLGIRFNKEKEKYFIVKDCKKIAKIFSLRLVCHMERRLKNTGLEYVSCEERRNVNALLRLRFAARIKFKTDKERIRKNRYERKSEKREVYIIYIYKEEEKV